MTKLLLGQNVEYKDAYDKNLLLGIPREIARNEIKLPEILPFKGVDIWNCYEISWLNMKGKPCVRIINLIVPAESECLIESKSLKLYFNSFNGTKFESEKEVLEIIEQDLSNVAQKKVIVIMKTLDEANNEPLTLFDGINIDHLDVEITDYNVNGDLLKLADKNEIVEETICSNLLKSNCLITQQPDWASIQIKYKGKQIDHKSLLKYIISFRNHNEFHEQCVEHIFFDIMQKCTPEKLTIHAKYTRRGGIDINPYRTNENLDIDNINKKRDIRQ